jgi:hypothetical protein
MVAHRRLDPSKGFADLFKHLERKIDDNATGPSGNIVIRDSLKVPDPSTGTETIIGVGPDGTIGVHEWVGDTTPPAKPSTPIASAYLGVLSAYWDGVGLLGEPNPPDYDRTDVEMSSSATGPWFKVGELRGEGSIQVTDQAYGEARFFRLISYDKVGNDSVPSDQASATATALVSDETIAEEIRRIDEITADQGTSLSNLTDEISDFPQQIHDAANSLITDDRIQEGTLTKWPFQPNTIPSGALQPGAVNGTSIADFSLAVTKMNTLRHQIY